MSTPAAIHVPLDPMTLEIHPVSSSHVSWVYRWSNVDLSSKVEAFSPDFGHANGWVWRLLLQHHTNPDGNRIYSLFLYVVLTDTELREPTWTRKIRVMQFQILNSEGRRLKDKSTIALFNEHQLTWGFPGIIDNTHLLRDPVVAENKKIDIICRLRYLPENEKIRRPMSPPVSGVYGRSFENTTPDMTDHNAAAKAFDPRAVVVDPVGASLRSLVNNPTFSDVQIIVGPQRQLFHGHRPILAARSVWFESALNPMYREASEGVIRLPEEDPKIFEMLFEFLYTGDYPLAPPGGIGLLPAPVSASPIVTTIKTERRSPSPSVTPSPMPNGVRQFREDKSSLSAHNGYDPYYDNESDDGRHRRHADLEDFDDVRFQLYLIADKYGVSQLKCLIRVHLTNELLDPASGLQGDGQGHRLLRLIRFAFEELPEAVTGQSGQHSDGTALRCPTGMSTLSNITRTRDNNSLGEEALIDDGGLGDRVVSPGVPGFERVYARGNRVSANNSPSPSTAANNNNVNGIPDSSVNISGNNTSNTNTRNRSNSSIFAPPPPPQVNLPLSNSTNTNSLLGVPNSNPSSLLGGNNSSASLLGGATNHTGSLLGGSNAPGIGLYGSNQSNIGFAMTTGAMTPNSMTPGPINGHGELIQRENSRLTDRDTRRNGSPFGFRGGWQSSASNYTTTTISGGLGERYGRYGRDNETSLLRDSIVNFVAKMFPAVRSIEGFEEMMKEGGEMGGFATEVMERMFRP